MKTNKKNFTMIELMMVVLLVAILASITFALVRYVTRRQDELRVKALIQMIVTANEQYKQKYGYYVQPSQSNCVPWNHEFLGDAYEIVRNMYRNQETSENKASVHDIWGHRIVYRVPGKYNKASFDVYSRGADTVDEDGKGDDIANFVRK